MKQLIRDRGYIKCGIARRECFEMKWTNTTKGFAILSVMPFTGIKGVGFNIFTPKNLWGWYLRVAINLSRRSRRIILTKQTFAIKSLIQSKFMCE